MSWSSNDYVGTLTIKITLQKKKSSSGSVVASKSKLGASVLAKTMTFQAKARVIGVNGKLFGYAAYGTKSFGNKALPKITNGWYRAGWAQGASKGSVAWRIGSRENTRFSKMVFEPIKQKLRYFRRYYT